VIAHRRQFGQRADLRTPSDAGEHVVDHSRESEPAPVLGRVDPGDAIGFEFGDLGGGNGATAAHHHPDVCGAELSQHVDHVAEIFVVAALVAADGDGVGVFGDGGAHDVGDAAVVPRCTTSAPRDCSRRRIMLMAAS
jgi:hypothetical protein